MEEALSVPHGSVGLVQEEHYAGCTLREPSGLKCRERMRTMNEKPASLARR